MAELQNNTARAQHHIHILCARSPLTPLRCVSAHTFDVSVGEPVTFFSSSAVCFPFSFTFGSIVHFCSSSDFSVVSYSYQLHRLHPLYSYGTSWERNHLFLSRPPLSFFFNLFDQCGRVCEHQRNKRNSKIILNNFVDMPVAHTHAHKRKHTYEYDIVKKKE